MFHALSLRVVQVVAVQDVRGVDMGGRWSKGKVPEIILASGQLSNLPSKNPSSLSAIFVQSSCYSEWYFWKTCPDNWISWTVCNFVLLFVEKFKRRVILVAIKSFIVEFHSFAFWDVLTILSYTIISTSGKCLGFHINIKRDRMLLFMGSKSQVACGILISSYPLVKIQPKRKLFSNFRRYSFSCDATNINDYKYCLYILLLCHFVLYLLPFLVHFYTISIYFINSA